MFPRAIVIVLLALGAETIVLAGAEHPQKDIDRPVRVVGETTVVGESDPLFWKSVLDVLPAHPRRIEVLDLASLTEAARRKVRGLDAFVVAGHTTIVVIRQAATLRHAEMGDAFDRLALASLIWHELAHVNGLDERGALGQEQVLWRRFVGAGIVDPGFGMSYIARLREVAAHLANPRAAGHPPMRCVCDEC